MATNRPHDEYCWHCDMAEFAGITYAAAHTEAASPNRCKCGVLRSVSHYCSALDHAWVGKRPILSGCLYHSDDPYPAGCADCRDRDQQDAAPEQTCRDHGPHLGFHWCPECYQRAFTAGVESTQGSGRDVALEGALKAKAEEWEVEAATCENRRGIENFKRDPQRFAILTRVARELRALLSAPAAAGSEPK
jgi:hypothetical protein